MPTWCPVVTYEPTRQALHFFIRIPIVSFCNLPYNAVAYFSICITSLQDEQGLLSERRVAKIVSIFPKMEILWVDLSP